MRDIKFRAWDKNKMVDVPVNHSDYSLNELIDGIQANYELMQYIGLKDKNGVEIYEGDIITRMSGGLLGDGKLLYTGRVEYQDLGYVAVYKEKRLAGTSHEEVVSKWGHIVNPSELEIIGNIYENPDLLK